MKHLRPGTKILLAFVISFFATYGFINLVISQINHREQLVHKEAAQILQNEISEQFNRILDVTFVIGQLSSVYIFDQHINNSSYEVLVKKVLDEKEFILGLNQLNIDGKIITIYPLELNQGAMGKISQNYSEVLKSYQRKEKFWFSPPFQLYQGETGFVFYIPIEAQGKLMGWMAPVISSRLFFEHFRTMDFFNKYELVIKDGLTGNVYFGTGLPPKDAKIEEAKSKMWERDILFHSWPKTNNPKFAMPFLWRFIICLFTGLFFGMMMKIHLQKRKAYARLENISDLLKLTSNEALSKLMDIQSEYLKIGSTGFLSTSVVEKDVQSVTNLIEQIELLQNIAGSEQLHEETFEILPIISEHIKELRDVISKKNLDLKIDGNSFKEIMITGNKWLVSNTVLKNALSYSALISRPEGKIEITHVKTPGQCSTIFHIDKVYEEEIYTTFKIDRRLMVARNVMDLLNGNIAIHEDGSGGMILKLTLIS